MPASQQQVTSFHVEVAESIPATRVLLSSFHIEVALINTPPAPPPAVASSNFYVMT